MSVKTGDRVTMCVREASENGIEHGRIVRDFGTDAHTDYYDLYNEDGLLACMDGETCIVKSFGKNGVFLANAEGKEPVSFFLEWSEFDMCCSPCVGGNRG